MYEPAWPGVNPGVPDFRTVVPERNKVRIERLLHIHFFPSERVHILGALRERAGEADRYGHYKVAVGAHEFVARIRPNRNQRNLELAAEVAAHAAAGGVNVATYRKSIGGRVEVWEQDCAVTVANFSPARHVKMVPAECAALGRALAALHNALDDFPKARSVESAWIVRANDLDCAQQACRKELPPGIPESLHELVRRAVERYDSTFSMVGGKPQCVHGDVTPGNVLITSDGSALLCDFEDAAEAFWPRGFDVCSAVLRFARTPEVESSAAREAALIGAYADESREPLRNGGISRGIENLLHHNFMVMVDATLKGLPVMEAEWMKFARLAATMDA